MAIALLLTILPILLLVHAAAAGHQLRKVQESLLPDGIWTSRGHGYSIQVVNGTTILFEETDSSCIVNPFLLEGIYDVQLSPENDNVALVSVFRFVPYFVFDRTDSFQAGCRDGPTPVTGDENYNRDALVVFDVLNQTFVEHFAHFDNRIGGLSEWLSLAEEARAKLLSNSTDDELVSAFESLLVPLDEYHTWIMDVNGDFLVESHEFLWQFRDEFEEQDVISDWNDYQEEMILTPWRKNAGTYMKDGLKIEPTGIAWGRTDESIGYIWLRTIPNDIFSFVTDFTTALTALNNTDALVLDIRINSGGSDQTAILIASHFTSEPYLAFTKQAVGGDVLEVYVEPNEILYSKPVIMIIGGSSYSAAETLPLAMMQLPQVKLLGRNTGGSYSELPKTLPNGWPFSLFNELYLSPEGVDYDKVGIPPDIMPETELLPLSERQAGTDSWLELALQTAQEDYTSDEASKVEQSWALLCLAVFLMAVVKDQ